MPQQYLVPWARYGKVNPVAEDISLGKELWAWLEEQIKDL
jgi:retinol dehydrogenase 12